MSSSQPKESYTKKIRRGLGKLFRLSRSKKEKIKKNPSVISFDASQMSAVPTQSIKPNVPRSEISFDAYEMPAVPTHIPNTKYNPFFIEEQRKKYNTKAVELDRLKTNGTITEKEQKELLKGLRLLFPELFQKQGGKRTRKLQSGSGGTFSRSVRPIEIQPHKGKKKFYSCSRRRNKLYCKREKKNKNKLQFQSPL